MPRKTNSFACHPRTLTTANLSCVLLCVLAHRFSRKRETAYIPMLGYIMFTSHEGKFTYWSSHNNFCSLLKCFGLLIFVTTTKHSCSMDVVHFSKPPRFNEDLLAKFSCRGTDECNGPVARLKLRLVHDMNQRWPQESCCLTRTCFSNANDISTTECYGDSLKKRVSFSLIKGVEG